MFTPESEKRIIKRTLDEDDEINALYGAFGLTVSSSKSSASSGLRNVHQRQTITEPSMPMKSSSSLLRRLALQDLPDNADEAKHSDAHGAEEGWWAGGIAASLGRAAKSMIDRDRSPPTRYDGPPDSPGNVGLGLAKSPHAVRKIRSNFEMDRRRGVSEEPQDISPLPQEQRAPIRAVSESPKRNPVFKGASSNPSPLRIETVFDTAPPACDEDAFGYSPLPLDYEDQCDDDELYSVIDSFRVGSLGSTGSRSASATSTTSDSGTVHRNIEGGIGLGLGIDSDGSIEMVAPGGEGQRIMLDAVEYDEEFDSPRSQELDLPDVEDELTDTETFSAQTSSSSTRPDARRMSTEPEAVQQATKPATKYGDRATKLRMARSTPALRHQQSGWFDSIRSVVLSRAGYAPADTEPPVPVSTFTGPMRISPALPAAPTLVTASPVICDSTSAEAVDLPAIPPSITVTSASGESSYVPLRLRSSLAALRTVVGLPERRAGGVVEGDTPVLSPRLDWKAQGSQFAGWEKGKHGADSPRRIAAEAEGLGLGKGSGLRGASGTSIDYSKSFFYKPATPPHPSHRTSFTGTAGTNVEATADNTEGSENDHSGPAPRKEPAMAKRRSIKSLRAALLIPVAAPPVPAIPRAYRSQSGSESTLAPKTPPMQAAMAPPIQPPILAISSPGAWEAGLPPRELVLEGEEWDARDGGGVPGEWGRRGSKVKGSSKKRSLKKKTSVGV